MSSKKKTFKTFVVEGVHDLAGNEYTIVFFLLSLKQTASFLRGNPSIMDKVLSVWPEKKESK